MTRKIDEYRLGDKVEVGRLHGTEVTDWKAGTIVTREQHLSERTYTTLLVRTGGGTDVTIGYNDEQSIRYPSDAIAVGVEVEVEGTVITGVGAGGPKFGMQGVVVGPVSDHLGYWVRHTDGYTRHWPAEKVRPVPVPVPVPGALTKAMDALANVQGELAATREQLLKATRRAEGFEARLTQAQEHVAYRDTEWKRIVGVNGRLVEETNGWCKRATEAEAELAKVKEAHGVTTKAQFAAAFNLGVARSERDDAQKALAAEQEHCKGLRDAFREALAKKERDIATLKSTIGGTAMTAVAKIDQINALTRRAETAEKALAERADAYGAARKCAMDVAIADIEEMWKRKFEALEKRVGVEQALRLAVEARLQDVKRVLG